MTNEEKILKEQYFPYENMSFEEREFLLELIGNCKDVCDSELGKNRQGTLVELSMNKKGSEVHLSGSVSYGDENRTIVGDVFYIGNKIVIDTHITRLCVSDKRKEYTMLDTFIPTEDGYKRESYYNFDMIKHEASIDMKGRVK